jgi:SAM-dependent methyltransferase
MDTNIDKPVPIAAAFTNDRVVENILVEAKKKSISTMDVLDLGSGTGYNAWKLSEGTFGKMNIGFVCVDFDQENFKLPMGERMKFIRHDLNNSFDFGKFDFIIATEVIEHLENPYAFIRNCIANLKKEGTLYVSTPNVANIYSVMKIFFQGIPYCFWPYVKGGHDMPFFPFMMKIAAANIEELYGKKLVVESFYNKNILKFYPSQLHFWLPGYRSQLFGESAIWKIYFSEDAG